MLDELSEVGLATWIAFASLAVSLFVLVRQHRAAGRAHLTAEWDGSGGILVTNQGPGPAQDVSLSVPGAAHVQDRTVSYIGTLQSIRIRLSRALGESASTVVITWRDNRWRQIQPVEIELGDPPPPIRSSPAKLESTVREMIRQEIADQKRRSPRR